MSIMNSSLPDEFKAFVDQRIQADGYGTSIAVVVKLVVAYLLVNQVIFWAKRDSLFWIVFGFRYTSSIVLQSRVSPDQRLGLAWRAAA